MFNQFNPMVDIDRRIQDLENLKKNYQNMPQQQPITNIINTTGSSIQFEARILNENEKVDEILIKNKTMFFDPFKAKLTIKEINGDVKEYDVILPKTQEQLKIEELERKLEEYERLYTTNNEECESRSNDNEQHDTSTKNDGRNIFKKSK